MTTADKNREYEREEERESEERLVGRNIRMVRWKEWTRWLWETGNERLCCNDRLFA